MGEISITVSEDQNTITLDDGTVLVSRDKRDMLCSGCFFDVDGSPCVSGLSIPCWTPERKDAGNKIFIKEPVND